MAKEVEFVLEAPSKLGDQIHKLITRLYIHTTGQMGIMLTKQRILNGQTNTDAHLSLEVFVNENVPNNQHVRRFFQRQGIIQFQETWKKRFPSALKEFNELEET